MLSAPPRFNATFRDSLTQLFAWRRDVRRFTSGAVSEDLISALLDQAQLSPSVGNSQPWRWVRVERAAARAKVRENFATHNAQALSLQSGERALIYAKLKLAGLETAPVQFAVFCDGATTQGHSLGRVTMPEMLNYSVVAMIVSFWLAARAHGLGLGWVSILDPSHVTEVLQVPEGWKFIAYLCIGWPQEEHIDPELVRHGWQARTAAGRTVISR